MFNFENLRYMFLTIRCLPKTEERALQFHHQA